MDTQRDTWDIRDTRNTRDTKDTRDTMDTRDIRNTSDIGKWALFRVYICNLIVYYVHVMDSVLSLMVSLIIKAITYLHKNFGLSMQRGTPTSPV